MIDIKAKTITQGSITEKIVAWEVWYLTINGYHRGLDEALADAEEHEMPTELIRPMVVVVGEHALWEPVHK